MPPENRFPPTLAIPRSHVPRDRPVPGAAADTGLFNELRVTGDTIIEGDLGVGGAVVLLSTLAVGGLTYTWPASQANHRVLHTDGAGTLTWAQVDLTTEVTGILPSAHLSGSYTGITGVGTLSAGAVPASLVTAGTFGAGAYTFPSSLAITGALTGVTTLTTSGAINGQTISSAASFTGTVVVTSTLTNNGLTALLAQSATSARVDVGTGSGSSSSALAIQRAAGQVGDLRFRTGTTDRWILRAQNNTESGSNAGTNLELAARDDAGVAIDSVFIIPRAAGSTIAFSAARPITGGTYNGQTISSAASFTGTLASGAHTISTTSSLPLQLTRTGSGSNTAIGITNTDGSVFFGLNSNERFGIAATNTLTTDPWLTIDATTCTLLSSLTSASLVVGSGTGSGTSQIGIYGAAGQTRQLTFRSGSLQRWNWAVSTAAESGSDAGSNFALNAFDDAGSSLGSVVTFVRAAGGLVTWTRPMTTNQQITSTLATGTAPLTVTSTTKVANLNADRLDDQEGSYYSDAANLTGTVASARISGSYTGITGVGTITAGTWTATAIGAIYGGTAQTSWTLGDLLYASASNTLSKLAGNTTTTKKFLSQTGAAGVSAAPVWGTTPYALQVCAAEKATVIDTDTMYFGMSPWQVSTTPDAGRVWIPRSGTITAAYVDCYFNAAVGSNENWSIYLRLNNTTDTLIATVGSTANPRQWSNTGLSIAVSAGDTVSIKVVNPTWGTNPQGLRFSGSILVE
jgi:hypothetical protein